MMLTGYRSIAGSLLIVFSCCSSLLYTTGVDKRSTSTIYQLKVTDQPPRLVKLTRDDHLVYEMYANEGESDRINRIPDFSYAGYKGGGVSLPQVAVKKILTSIPGDNHKQIQDAIDEVSSLPPDSDGLRGKILLKAGVYHVDGTISIKASGVVLAGEGQDENGTVLVATKRSKHIFIKVGSRSEEPRKLDYTMTPVTSDYVPTGSTVLSIGSVSGYNIGDTIVIQKTPNEEWVKQLDMGQYGWTPETYQIPHERIISAIKGNQITVNIPLVDPIKKKDGGGLIYKIVTNRNTKQSGVENVRLQSVYDHNEDEQHAWFGIKLEMSENCWVKNVTCLYFGFSAVTIDKNSAYNTVEDCAMLDPKAKTEGARKYSFNIQSGSFNLFQRCYTRGGRHDFVTGPRVTGPNVFLDCYAADAKSDIGPHHRWATGTLFDNVQGQNIRVRNRKSSGSGHGWAGAQTMVWNCISTSPKGMTVESPEGCMNWVIGGEAKQLSGNGYHELLGKQVMPRSLYLAQLQNRLGHAALLHVTTASQRKGVIYAELVDWAGEH
ncbi:hypothetical protein ACSX1A_09955 [Pontibacter sp. MBLB2868]|uniref:hypothetical protein n=1 Tax=Pontibacter sp. MBLB2868 TaxID=3451555 RepID=UPI003F750F5D